MFFVGNCYIDSGGESLCLTAARFVIIFCSDLLHILFSRNSRKRKRSISTHERMKNGVLMCMDESPTLCLATSRAYMLQMDPPGAKMLSPPANPIISLILASTCSAAERATDVIFIKCNFLPRVCCGKCDADPIGYTYTNSHLYSSNRARVHSDIIPENRKFPKKSIKISEVYSQPTNFNAF